MLHASPITRNAPVTVVTVPCPLCEAPVQVTITAAGDWIDDVEVTDVACGHDVHPLVDSLGFNDACCEAAREKWGDR